MAQSNISGQAIFVAPVTPQAKLDRIGQRIASFKADFTLANSSYLIDLTTQIQANLFSTPETMFIDNSTNPNAVIATVSGTQQTFEAPPFSNGFYTLASGASSQVTLSSVGGASAVNNVQLFNYFIPPVVWLTTQAGGGGTAVTVADGADSTLGSKADAAIINPGVGASLIALTKGVLTELISLVALGKPQITWTQTLITLVAATNQQVLASNASRKALRWMNTGVNPFTAVPGAVAAVAGNGMSYGGNNGVGTQGGSDSFTDNEISTQAWQMISTIGTTLVIWEGQ